ncbi:MAG: SHOCT domain-containing protein [Actinomycetota bacterium]|nr:SHOCT domain-containing protein [Actinomycetota bacterium]
MSLLVFLVIVLAGGLLIGALARLAVPGPDPMPLWATAALGVAGSVVGGVIARVALGSAGGLPIGFAASVLLLIVYRRVVQKRGITGPAAKERPTRGIGVHERALEQRSDADQLRKLERLRAAGVISEDEFERREAELRRGEESPR